MALKVDRNFVGREAQSPKLSPLCDASDGERVHLYSPRGGAIPFAPPPRRRPTDVCLSAAHSLSILQFKRAFLSCLPLPRLAGKNLCGTMDPSSCLPPFTSLSLCHRNRHSPSLVSLHQSRIDGMASFPLSFFCSLSLSPLSFAYIYGRNAPTIMSTLITIKRELLHSRRVVSPHLERSCVTSRKVLLCLNRPTISDEQSSWHKF